MEKNVENDKQNNNKTRKEKILKQEMKEVIVILQYQIKRDNSDNM